MFARITTRMFELLIIVAVVLIAVVIVGVQEGGLGGPANAQKTAEELLNELEITRAVIEQSKQFPVSEAVKLKDYWGHPLHIEQTGELRLTQSIGPDGKPDTADDIKTSSEAR